uniref:Uncharacterized protein n=1 Tax=Corethron hystrix TaxID=216773 RepID=A0A7S1BJR9_9STRA|mmetsp:Transcript_30973/g.70815  ORF Transcript_30973/g.70815 Transcript_30973/m.70815 type:complete len:134 (+) Transcript_30973:115-516(+)
MTSEVRSKGGCGATKEKWCQGRPVLREARTEENISWAANARERKASWQSTRLQAPDEPNSPSRGARRGQPRRQGRLTNSSSADQMKSSTDVNVVDRRKRASTDENRHRPPLQKPERAEKFWFGAASSRDVPPN